MFDSFSGRCPTRRVDVSWRLVEDEIFICSSEGDFVFTLRDVAAAIWQACDGSATTEEIVTTLIKEYEVERDVLTEDLEEFLASLQKSGLLE